MLGMDFLRAHAGILVMSQDVLILDGKYHYNCERESKLATTFRVNLNETLIIPPLGEMLVPGRVDDMPGYDTAIVEPNPKLMESKALLIAKLVVDPSGGQSRYKL